MALSQTDTIDLMAQGPEGDQLLAIVVGEPWTGKSEQLLRLQEKVNNYISFVQSGQLEEVNPDAKGQPVTIDVHSMTSPGKRTQAFLEKLGDAVEARGFGFRYSA